MHINFYPAYLQDLLTLHSRVYSLREVIITLSSILPVKLGTLYLKTLERSPLWLVLNV